MTSRPANDNNEVESQCSPPPLPRPIPQPPCHHHHNRKPNASLSIDEKIQKRNLKKRLKIQQRIQKLQKRIQHAKSRRDPIVEQRAREELKSYLVKNGMNADDDESADVSFGVGDGNSVEKNTSVIPELEGKKADGSYDDEKSMQCLIEEESRRFVLSVSSRLFSFATADDATANIDNQIDKQNYIHAISNDQPPSTEVAGEPTAKTIKSNSNGNNTASPNSKYKKPTTNHVNMSSTSNHGKSQLSSCSSSSKITQTNQAIQLLRHMTKGTQSLSMFDNKQALWGYTRQKFYERAMLVAKSLLKLSELSSSSSLSATSAANDDDVANSSVVESQQNAKAETTKNENIGKDKTKKQNKNNNDDEEGMSLEQIRLGAEMWTHLMKIKTACSIGCGPGNDIVGLISFLLAANNATNTTTINSTVNNNSATSNVTTTSTTENKTIPTKRREGNTLECVHLLDFAIVQWEETILKPLKLILVPDFADFMECGYCDITQSPFRLLSLQEKPNEHKKDNVTIIMHNDDFAQNTDKNNDDVVPSQTTPSLSQPQSLLPTRAPFSADIILISYLLSETRGKWDKFLQDVIVHTKPGTLFYFAEPTPWQLFRVIEMFSKNDDRDDEQSTGESGDGGACNDRDHRCYEALEFLWIDSSMHHPNLQSLDGRLGPAVLLGIKR